MEIKEAITLINRKKLITLLLSFSLLIGCSTIPYPAKANSLGSTFHLSTQYGGITITGSQICYYAGPTDKGGYTVETLGPDDEIIIYGSGNYGITVIAGQRSTFDIVLQNVNINTSSKKDESAFDIGPYATVNLKLEGNNTLQSGEDCAGIQVPELAVLNFESYKDNSGTLNAVGGEWAAGIGGGFQKAPNGYTNLQAVGQINLNYYRINAVGGDFGAGIGGGWGKDGGQITINGGTVTATGGWGGAGIGGGDGGNGGTIIINDGNITAQRTYYRESDKKYYPANSASIGGGNDGKGGNININGGTVTTQPIERNSQAGKLYDSGTGIGGGWDGDAGTITIRGGAITVYSNSSATGIGGGYGDTTAGNGGTIIISGGRVTVDCTAGTAIGGGRSIFKEGGAGGTIQISGGYVSAHSGQGVAIGGSVSLTLSKAPPVNTGSGPRPTYDIGVQAGGGAITSFGGATINFAVPYALKAGEDESALVMYYHGPHCDVPVRGFFRNNAMSASTSHLSEYYIGYNKVTFQDVPSESWYSNAVTFIAAREITKGTSSGLFSPNKTLTRGEFMAMLLRAYCIEPDTNLNGNFYDAGDTYYTGYLATAKRLGIALGSAENKFEPDKELTRQDMFTLLNRTLTVLHERPAGVSKNLVSNFSDASSVSGYAQEAVKTLVEKGIISGSNGKINPSDLTNRAEMAQMLYKLLSQESLS